MFRLVLLVSFFMSSAFAQKKDRLQEYINNAMPQCPKFSKDFTGVYEGLKTLSASVDNVDECAGLLASVETLSKSFNGGKIDQVTEILEIAEIDPRSLSSEDLDVILNYSEQVSTSVTGVIDLANTQRKCISKGKEASFLGKVASAARQVSSISSQFSSITTSSVTLLGTVFAGIVQGVDNFFEKDGYDFSNIEHRDLYRTNLCMYQDIRQQVETLTVPFGHRNDVEANIFYLSKKAEVIIPEKYGCTDCLQIKDSLDVRQKVIKQSKIINYNVDKIELELIEKGGSKLVKACEELGRYVHYSANPLYRISLMVEANKPQVDRIQNYYDELQRLYSVINEAQVVLTPEMCLTSKSYRRRDFFSSVSAIRAYVENVENFYKQQALLLKDKFDSEYARQTPVGTWMYDSVRSRYPAEGELVKINKRIGAGTASARMEIEGMIKDLDKRLIINQGVDFINYHFGKVKKKEKWFKKGEKILLSEFNKRMPVKSSTLYEVFEYIKQKKIEQKAEEKLVKKDRANQLQAIASKYRQINRIGSSYFSELNHLVMGYDYGVNAYLTVGDYCSFFSDVGMYLPVLDVCEKVEGAEVAMRFLSKCSTVSKYVDARQWASENGYKLQPSRYEILNEKIKRWHSSLVEEYEQVGTHVNYCETI